MNAMLFIRLVGQLYAEALSRYNDLVIFLFSVKHLFWQNIILICFDCNITFESFLTYDLPLRQHSLLKLTCCKLAIIKTIIGWIKPFHVQKGLKTHHHGLISSEFQTGNSSIILQKWQCEVWSCFKKQLILAVSDIESNALWIPKSKWMISKGNFLPKMT